MINFMDALSKKKKGLNAIDEDIDVLIRFNSNILRGDILNCTRFGILSFHTGDNRVVRGGPAGFWEVFNNEDTSGFILQILTQIEGHI